MTVKLIAPFRILAVCGLAGTVLLGAAPSTRAAGSRMLKLADFGGISAAQDVSGKPDGAVAGTTYAHALLLQFFSSKMVLFVHRFPGYGAFSFEVGVPDSAAAGSKRDLAITVDGKVVRDVRTVYGQSATRVVLPLHNVTSIALTDVVGGDGIVIADPTLLAGDAAAPAPVPAPGTGSGGLQVLSASVAAGGQETAVVTTGAGASVTLVVSYPDNTQQIVGPDRAGPDGRFAFIWTVPRGIQGAARIAAVSSGVTQASFIIQ